MKKIITLSIIAVMVSILFSSCKSSTSVLKRHYNKGYYFAHSKSKHSTTRSKEEKIAKISVDKPVYSLPEQIAKPVINQNENQNPTVNNGVVLASNEKNTTKLKNEIKPSFKLKPLTITEPIKQIKNKLINMKNKSTDHDDHDGLSLFWLIIVLILILWALGFLVADMGGAIHVLLVVALILFILWILGIV